MFHLAAFLGHFWFPFNLKQLSCSVLQELLLLNLLFACLFSVIQLPSLEYIGLLLAGKHLFPINTFRKKKKAKIFSASDLRIYFNSKMLQNCYYEWKMLLFFHYFEWFFFSQLKQLQMSLFSKISLRYETSLKMTSFNICSKSWILVWKAVCLIFVHMAVIPRPELWLLTAMRCVSVVCLAL